MNSVCACVCVWRGWCVFKLAHTSYYQAIITEPWYQYHTSFSPFLLSFMHELVIGFKTVDHKWCEESMEFCLSIFHTAKPPYQSLVRRKHSRKLLCFFCAALFCSQLKHWLHWLHQQWNKTYIMLYKLFFLTIKSKYSFWIIAAYHWNHIFWMLMI